MGQTLDSADNAGQTNYEGDSDSPEHGFYRKPEITVRSQMKVIFNQRVPF